MPNSLPPVILPSKTVVDLYAATDIAVGTQLVIQNLGSSLVYVSEQDSLPDDFDGLGKNIIEPKRWVKSNSETPVGQYAFCYSNISLQVEEA